MGDLQRLSPCGRVEPQVYGGRKIRDFYSNSKVRIVLKVLVCGLDKRYNKYIFVIRSFIMRIYARNTSIKPISDESADNFIAQYHRQGLCKFGGSRFNAGLFYQGQLVGEASFSNPRTKAKIRRYQQELVRMTFKTDVTIVGGASKLIKYYIDNYKPRNFFTYQSRLGKTSKVYEYAGMTLRKHESDKHILVKNGYTYESAVKEYQVNKTKYLYLNSQLVNLGPDHILKTKLGSKFDDAGNRLTNRELFIKYCDYHDEVVAGDNVYDFNNDKYVHYIYKITSSDPNDKFYYIGRHSVYTETPLTDNDLLKDGYLGSGGNRFKEWKQNVIDSGFSLQKEILTRQSTWTDNVKAEKKFVGVRYKDDPFCLNLVAGGISACVSNPDVFTTFTTGYCKIHGKTLFRNKYCCKCMSLKVIHMDMCEVHGKTTFNGKQCLQCQIQQMWHIGNCPIHGETKFCGKTCARCISARIFKIKKCPIHGAVKFQREQCTVCKVERLKQSVHLGTCPIHGKTKFKGSSCCKCTASANNKLGLCPIHGKTKFNSGVCVKCRNAKQYHMDYCKIHGYTKFRKDKCCKCSSAQRFHMGDCPIHGHVKFCGKVCLTCKNRKIVTHKWCDVCRKVTSHNGNTCMNCVNRERVKNLSKN